VPTDPLQLADALRLPDPRQVELAHVPQPEVTLDQPGGLFRQVDASGLGALLHALGEPDRVTLRRVVHAQVGSDLPDDHVAGVETHPNREVESAPPQLIGVAPQRIAQVQRRVARPLRVVLVRDRRAEERHDAVARVLVDRPLEAVHAVGQDLEKAIEDRVPLLGIDLLG
jgi:hypothetical protein